MAKHDANQGQGHRCQNDQRQLERAELSNDQDINADQGDDEGRAHIAERDIGDFPFAVPKQRWIGFIIRLAVITDNRFWQIAPVVLVNLISHRQHAIDRRFKGAGKFA